MALIPAEYSGNASFVLSNPKYVDISGYTPDNMYTPEYDGYVSYTATESSKRVVFCIGDNNNSCLLPANSEVMMQTFVKKGLPLYFRTGSTFSAPSQARFYPIEY